ncbi:MAG: type II CAAX endopeptidase family protein [Candidatus Limnocylindrales bacterium]
MSDPQPDPESAPSSRPRVGLTHFTIEGRSAPGLFVAGWVLLLLAVGAAFVGFMAGRSPAGIVLFIVGVAGLLVALLLLGGSQALERRAAGLAYAGPSPILTFIAVVAGWYLAAVVVLTPLQLLGIRPEGPVLTLLGIGIQALVVLGLVRLMVVGSDSLSWSDMGVRRLDATALRDFAWGAVLAGPVVLATGLVVLVLVNLIGQQPDSPLPPTGSTGGLLLNLLSGAVIAPFYEELFFRGFTLTAWRRMAGPMTAIVRSGVLFALIHVIDQSADSFGAGLGVAVVAAVGRLPVALVLGWVYDRRGSLWASIGLHATFNAFLLIIAERALLG